LLIEKKVLMGILYLISTPIGNMGDISARAVETLKGADLIAAEDTRVTGALLKKLGVKPARGLISYYEHNKRAAGEYIISELKNGRDAALVTDAGTPAISDPGEDLVAECIKNGIPMFPIPGACAFLCALTVSGFSTKKFTFTGFLPGKGGERKKELEKLKNNAETLIFYEAPHRLLKTLADMSEIFGGERKICLSREITKKFEEHRRCTLADAVKYYSETPPKGEFVIVAEGGREAENALNSLSAAKHVEYYVDKGMPRKDAMKQAARDRGVSKREIYNELL
jgi:16S rRNA (cytidine1402-2'-O)-methyltransferase